MLLCRMVFGKMASVDDCVLVQLYVQPGLVSIVFVSPATRYVEGVG